MKKQKQEIEYVICHNEEINKDLEEKLYKSYKEEEEKIERWGVILHTIVLVVGDVLMCLLLSMDKRLWGILVGCFTVIIAFAISFLSIYLQQKKINERETFVDIVLEDIEVQKQVLQQALKESDNEQIQRL